MQHALEGGCLCGAIRYRIGRVFDVVYCHCATCRRRCGAPVTLSVVVPKDAFEVIEGETASYRATERGTSHFCAACGAPLFFVEAIGPFASVSHGSLDQPEAVRPMAHQWTGEALPWLEIQDGLPHFRDGTLSHPEKR